MRARRGIGHNNNGTPEEGLGEESANNINPTNNTNSTMVASPFAAGINKRKGKSNAAITTTTARGRSILNGGCDNDECQKRHGRSLFSRPRHVSGGHVSLAGMVIASISLLSIIVVLVRNGSQSSWSFGLFRGTNPGWGKHPRVAKLETDPADTPITNSVVRLPAELDGFYPVPPLASKRFFDHLLNSDDFEESDEFETETCKAQYDWQLHSFPSCNNLHERALTTIPLVGNGYWRDVWVIPGGKLEEPHVLKTIRWEHDYTERNYDRHRRDALAMERLTSHPLVMDIYGYCGNSGLFEFAPGGDISDLLWPREDGKRTNNKGLPMLQRLHIATQAAIGLAALHNFDQEGRPSVAHTDIAPGQFVRVGDVFKLNDFNRARFIRKNVKTGELCSFEIGNNPGKNRSPEEYAYIGETEKIDVYSLGNIYYMLLMEQWPWTGVKEKVAKKKILEGERPDLYADIADSTDPTVVAIRTAMYMCHEQLITNRASARELEKYLKDRLEEIDPGQIEKWLPSGTA